MNTIPIVSAVVGLISAIVAILTVVLGLIVRATMAYSRLQSTVLDMVNDLDKHIVDERGERIELRTMTHKQLDTINGTLSRLDRDVARMSGRGGTRGSA